MSDGRGSVTVNNRNLGQGSFEEIERKFLFIGNVPKQGEEGQEAIPNHKKVVSVNAQTNVDDVFGATDSVLKTNLIAAQLNGGQNWEAWGIALDVEDDYNAAVDIAMDSCSPEAIVILKPATEEDTIKSYRDKALSINGTWGRQVFYMVASAGVDSTSQAWADYEKDQIELQADIAANRVCIVPQLHGNDCGVLAGRLCNRISSIADSPMRTLEPGSVLGLGETPVDKNGVALSSATLANLAANRISCIQAYPDYPGTYWGDASMLEVDGGDFQVIEDVRPALKIARAVRILGLNIVADRKLNSTPASIETYKTYFARPMREMSKTTRFAGTTFPGEIKPPKDDAIEITWHSIKNVEIFVKFCRYHSPKTIVLNVVLDLSSEAK